MITIHWLVRRPIPTLGLAAGDVLAMRGATVCRCGSRRRLAITPRQLARRRSIVPVSAGWARMGIGRPSR
jgi:hypothetical protein